MTHITITPQPQPVALQRQPHQHVCYVLLQIVAALPATPCAVNWAVVVDASRSMRIPMVDEAQFRMLAQRGSIHETLVDGVPVWQLADAVPPEISANLRSPLDHTAQALHASAQQLDRRDRFALVACATDTAILVENGSGAEQTLLAAGIDQLTQTRASEHIDLAYGLKLALQQLQRGRNTRRTERLLLLTDGFTDDQAACATALRHIAAEGIAIRIVGLGGECATDRLHDLAAQCGAEAQILAHPDAIHTTLAHELAAARSVVARDVLLQSIAAPGISLRRASRVSPAPALLPQRAAGAVIELRDLAATTPLVLLLEYIVEPELNDSTPLACVELAAGDATIRCELAATWSAHPPELLPAVASAAARATSMRLLERARAATEAGATDEAARLARAAARMTEHVTG